MFVYTAGYDDEDKSDRKWRPCAARDTRHVIRVEPEHRTGALLD
jgi:hypothetical protein